MHFRQHLPTEASESPLVSIVYIPFERCNLRSVSTLITSFSPFVMTRLIFRRDKFKFIICNRLRSKENFITHTWSSSQCVRKVNFVIDDAMDNSLQVELRLRWRFRRISVENILWPVGVVHVTLLIVWRHQNQIQNQHWTLGLFMPTYPKKKRVFTNWRNF